ncbi:hypothetical protein V9K67_09250 [Paraflavisolibacter sp. H34]|uniref:hypothetical protein n=1 Tax=Huijunlia imazamoxiresistens TaxID=3127457 RepID=UPI00301A9101
MGKLSWAQREETKKQDRIKKGLDSCRSRRWEIAQLPVLPQIVYLRKFFFDVFP